MSKTIDKSASRLAFLPWEMTLANLTAFAALALTAQGSIAIPILAVIMLIACFVPARFAPVSPLAIIARVIGFGAVIGLNVLRPKLDIINMFDTTTTVPFGELCAVELVVQYWRRHSRGRGMRVTLFSGLVFLCATSTSDESLIPYFVPIYLFLLLLALRRFSRDPSAGSLTTPSPINSEASEEARKGIRSQLTSKNAGRKVSIPWTAAARCFALLLFLFIGFRGYMVIRYYHGELSALASTLLSVRQTQDTSGISLSPRLGATFGLPDDLTQALRVEGSADVSHLRGIAFEIYDHGSWGPFPTSHRYTSFSTDPRTPPTANRPAVITRLINNNGILFVPLNASYLKTMENYEVQTSSDDGAILHAIMRAPSAYEVGVSEDENFQGVICVKPEVTRLQALLKVPPEIDAQVVALAAKIVSGLSDPREKVNAIQNYLLANNSYSLVTNPGDGDPVSSFILNKKAAHCEYFASATVIMLRCVGIPARYVVGYYAHESFSPGVTIVRQRDAHAWAECWLEGVGWITVDSTPGGGRPDRQAKPVPIWVKISERMREIVPALRAWIQKLDRRLVILVVCLVLAAFLGWQFWSMRRPAALQSSGNPAYFSENAELATLFFRFEAVFRQKQTICPAGMPWTEFLKIQAALDSHPAGDLDNAGQFLSIYNSARFDPAEPHSGSLPGQSLSRLNELLTRLETSLTPAEGSTSTAKASASPAKKDNL